jgi:RecA-family ATPase
MSAGLPNPFDRIRPTHSTSGLLDEFIPQQQWDRMPAANSKSPRVYTAGELVARPSTEVAKLVDPLLPAQGVVVLAGASDTGKSAFLRQLGLAVGMGDATFLGLPLNTRHRSAICVSTEDGDEAVGPMLKMQLRGRELSLDAGIRIRYLFEVDPNALVGQLDRMLSSAPPT